MPFVLDASIVLAWAFDERHPSADRARERLRSDQASAPSLWWFEVRNGLLMAERRGRSSESHSTSFLRALRRLAVRIDATPDDAALLSLARGHRLTVYDAAYLELARRERLPLATLDASLARAATAEGTVLIGEG